MLHLDEPFPAMDPGTAEPFAERADQVEREHLLRVLTRYGWKIEGAGHAAEALPGGVLEVPEALRGAAALTAAKLARRVGPERTTVLKAPWRGCGRVRLNSSCTPAPATGPVPRSDALR